MHNEHISQVTDANFDHEVLQAEVPVLLDFWAPWCGPCKALAPVLEDIASEQVGVLKVVKMDVDQNRDIPARFGVRGIPSLMLFKEGRLVASKTGAMTKVQLSGFVKNALAS